jgi:hypothetical protein
MNIIHMDLRQNGGCDAPELRIRAVWGVLEGNFGPEVEIQEEVQSGGKTAEKVSKCE